MAGCYVLATNLIGLALGPSSVALVSDYVFQSNLAVGKSLALIAAIFLPLAAWLVWRGLRAMQQVAVAEAADSA